MERVRTANPDHIPSRVLLAAYYEREGRHDQASVAVAEILRVTPDIRVARTREAFEAFLDSQEAAEYMEALRQAGLPERTGACGMVAGLIHDVPSCQELIDRIVREAENLMMQRFWAC